MKVSESDLTDADIMRLRAARRGWAEARAAGDWTRADRLRGYLQRAGCIGPGFERWHPTFEESAHRQRRLKDHGR